MKQRSPRALEATAYHEAGHAVAAFLTGIPVRGVSMSSEDGEFLHGNGFYKVPGERLRYDKPSTFRDRVERVVMVSIAGAEAQRKFDTKTWHRHQSEWDVNNALDLLLPLVEDGGEELEVYFKLLRIRTTALLDRNWQGVSAVATALTERAKSFPPQNHAWTIPGKEARHIFLDALGPPTRVKR